MKREDYDFLTGQRENMRLAVERDYIRGVSQRDVKRIAEIYRAVVEKPQRFWTYNCYRCVLTMLKELRSYYLKAGLEMDD